MVAEKKLSVRYTKFVDAIMAGMSRTEAFLAAGYKDRERPKLWRLASEIRRKPEVDAEINRRLEDLRQEYEHRMFTDVSDALDVRKKVVQMGRLEDRVKMDAIKDTLDRAGFKPVEKQETGGTVHFVIDYGDGDTDTTAGE